MNRLLLVLLFTGCCAVSGWSHDMYGDWMQPDNPTASCCHDADCRPVRADRNMDGHWLAYPDGLEILVPDNKVIKRPSPDGRSHWCGKGKVTYCFLGGEVRS